MSKNPNLVASGQTVSLADLGGVTLLSTPKKGPIKKTFVMVMPKPTQVDPFASDEDETIRLVHLENTTEAGTEDGGKVGTGSEEADDNGGKAGAGSHGTDDDGKVGD